jgi:hypothetical protein
MPTEPPNAEPPKRKRRWYQFSLRTLMIVVTMLCVAAWEFTDISKDHAYEAPSVVRFAVALSLLAVGCGFGGVCGAIQGRPIAGAFVGAAVGIAMIGLLILMFR